jgi:hypothetical protein
MPIPVGAHAALHHFQFRRAGEARDGARCGSGATGIATAALTDIILFIV